MNFKAWLSDSRTLWRSLLLLFALLNLLRLLQGPLDANRPVDFRNVYVGARLLWQGQQPYDDERLKAEWRQIAEAENIPFTTQPGLPVTPLLYPPWALSLFGVFTLFSYRIAFLLWYLLIPLLLVLACFWAGSWVQQGKKPAGGWLVDLLLLSLAFKGSVHAFLVGQPSFLAYAALFGVLYFEQKGKSGLAGLLLGLAAFKPTLALPFGLFLLAKKRWQILLIGAGITLSLEGMALLLNPDPVGLHLAYQAAAAGFRAMVFSPEMEGYPIHFIMTHLTELTVWVEYLVPGGHAAYPVIAILGLGAMLAVGWLKWKNRLSDAHALVLLCLLMFLSNYFSFYDLWILMPFGLLILAWPRTPRALAFLALLPLFLPFHGILNRLQLPESLYFLYFSSPLIVLLWLVLWSKRASRVHYKSNT